MSANSTTSARQIYFFLGSGTGGVAAGFWASVLSGSFFCASVLGASSAADGGFRALARENPQGERCEHEQDRSDLRDLGHQGGRAPGAEGRGASRAAERAGQVGRLSRLEKNGDDQDQADDDMQNRD